MSVETVVRVAAAAALLVVVLAAARARAPQRPTPRRELHRLVAGALGLYAVGAIAFALGRERVALGSVAAGALTAALAAWLSRGMPGDGPEDGGEDPEHPGDPRPPAPDDTVPRLDWDRFDRERATWSPPARR